MDFRALLILLSISLCNAAPLGNEEATTVRSLETTKSALQIALDEVKNDAQVKANVLKEKSVDDPNSSVLAVGNITQVKAPAVPVAAVPANLEESKGLLTDNKVPEDPVKSVADVPKTSNDQLNSTTTVESDLETTKGPEEANVAEETNAAQKTTVSGADDAEFEERGNEEEEGEKGEENPEENVAAAIAKPENDETDGVAKEDTEPDRRENVAEMVEEAKGNGVGPEPVQPQAKAQSAQINFEQSEEGHFMYIVVFAGIIVTCLYLLQHNKKRILGLMFEGRGAGGRRGNVRYRRLSQRDEDRENVIY